jgi:hypothetical protein
MKRFLAALLSFVLLFGFTTRPAEAYLKFGVSVSGRTVTLKWSTLPVRYFVTDRAAPGVTAQQLQATVAHAFSTWQAVSTASLSFEFVGFTGGEPGQQDGMSTLGFVNRPELERVLGSTNFLIDRTTGQLLEADIFFNSAFPWSVAPSGESGKFDLESIVLHETGHLIGLGHSALGETEPRPGGGRRVIAAEAVMFPIAFSPGSITDRSLKADDTAGVSDVYRNTKFNQDTGSITGRVTKNGAGIFGAHVIAFNPDTGKLIGSFSLNDRGEFVTAGLDPGVYIIRVEPLDDADVDSFFDDSAKVDLNFRTAFLDRLVAVPPGGTAAAIEVKVTPK